MSRQVLVQRLLLPGGANQSYDLLDVKHLQNNVSRFREMENNSRSLIHRQTEIEGTTDEESSSHFREIRNASISEETDSSVACSSYFNSLQNESASIPVTCREQEDVSMPCSSQPDSAFHDECSSK